MTKKIKRRINRKLKESNRIHLFLLVWGLLFKTPYIPPKYELDPAWLDNTKKEPKKLPDSKYQKHVKKILNRKSKLKSNKLIVLNAYNKYNKYKLLSKLLSFPVENRSNQLSYHKFIEVEFLKINKYHYRFELAAYSTFQSSPLILSNLGAIKISYKDVINKDITYKKLISKIIYNTYKQSFLKEKLIKTYRTVYTNSIYHILNNKNSIKWKALSNIINRKHSCLIYLTVQDNYIRKGERKKIFVVFIHKIYDNIETLSSNLLDFPIDLNYRKEYNPYK